MGDEVVQGVPVQPVVQPQVEVVEKKRSTWWIWLLSILGVLCLIVLVVYLVLFGNLFVGSGDLKELSVSTETFIIEEDIGNLKYVQLSDQGGEAVFLRGVDENDQLKNKIETTPIYEGVYKNKYRVMLQSNYNWGDNRIVAMVQDYERPISSDEFDEALTSGRFRGLFSEVTLSGEKVYSMSSEGDDIYMWRSSDRIVLIYPDNNKKKSDLKAIAKAYLHFYPAN